ncbi:MAG: ROK family protein [Treponema sp.]|jgi:glucokinase|nr:ROK family protein [Treponema sp.]
MGERNKRYFVGIDVGGTHFAIGVVDGEGKLLAKHTMPTGAGRPFGVIVKEMADTAKRLVVRAGLAESRIGSVGIGVPSTIDSKTGHLIFANNLDWRDLDLIGEFRKSWDVPVYVENDADCAALAESMDDAAKGKNTLLITFGTGFGGGLIMNGKIFKGGDNSGFEPGHFVLFHKGIQCTCGNYGCVEAYASVSALVRQTKEKMQACPDSLMWKECGADPEKVNGRTAFDAAKKGDAAAKEVVDAYIVYAALSIANLVTLFRPELIIIGGGLSAEGDYLIKPLYETAKSRIYAGELLGMPPIVPARLGNDAGIIGAALLGTVHI